jgi:hypothetical protein
MNNNVIELHEVNCDQRVLNATQPVKVGSLTVVNNRKRCECRGSFVYNRTKI